MHAERNAVLPILQRCEFLDLSFLATSPITFTLADQDGRMIARSSRLVEPFIFEALAGVVPEHGPVQAPGDRLWCCSLHSLRGTAEPGTDGFGC